MIISKDIITIVISIQPITNKIILTLLNEIEISPSEPQFFAKIMQELTVAQ